MRIREDSMTYKKKEDDSKKYKIWQFKVQSKVWDENWGEEYRQLKVGDSFYQHAPLTNKMNNCIGETVIYYNSNEVKSKKFYKGVYLVCKIMSNISEDGFIEVLVLKDYKENPYKYDNDFPNLHDYHNTTKIRKRAQTYEYINQDRCGDIEQFYEKIMNHGIVLNKELNYTPREEQDIYELVKNIKLNKLTIKNFKSLHDFELNFSDFICLIGLNGSGKSTILQAIDFISHQMKGSFSISTWLDNRGWDIEKIKYYSSKNKPIEGSITFTYCAKIYEWSFIFDTENLKCLYEEVIDVDKKNEIFKVKNRKYSISYKDSKSNGEVISTYEGSFLSSVEFTLPDVLSAFRFYLKNTYSLDLLSPNELKKHSQQEDTLGLTGKNLNSFLNSFSKEEKSTLLKQLKKYYKNLNNFEIMTLDDGTIRLEVEEKFGNKKLITESKYLNDGILRLITILAQFQTKKSFLLFDEIENGINTELVELLMDTLIASKHQIMVTTHSPMILNYIEDDVAIKSVQYIYKTDKGVTESIPFFKIPSMKEKLEMMGAGSAYVDTNLEDLIEEIETQKHKREI